MLKDYKRLNPKLLKEKKSEIWIYKIQLEKWRKTLILSKPNPRRAKTAYYLCPLAFIATSNVIFPFWFVDESALAYGSNSWTNLVKDPNPD